MTKKAYIGVNGVARQVKKIYIGVDGKARKVKKGYIGVGGVARPFFGGEPELAYYGTVTPLSGEVTKLAATSIGDYALFAGGAEYDWTIDSVDAYSKILTKSTPTGLSQGRAYLSATSVGNYALFAGGESGDLMMDSEMSATVDAYDTSLTRSTPTGLSRALRCLAATSIGGYALFAGGYDWESRSSVVDAYDANLTKSTPTGLSQERAEMSATSVGGYALFAGGECSGVITSNIVEAYNKSLVRSTPTGLSQGRTILSATSVGGYALFAGGEGEDSVSPVVDAYNTSLTRSTPTALSVARCWLAATSIGGYALFAGGSPDTGAGGTDSVGIGVFTLNTVDAYDKSLVRSTQTGLSQGRAYLSATSIGNYALFAGGEVWEVDGWVAVSSCNVVDVYTVS